MAGSETRRPEGLPFAPAAGPPIPLKQQLRAYAASAMRDPDHAKFLLFAQGRLGSTLFGELLASHPQVTFGDEVLKRKVAAPYRYIEGLRRAPRHRDGVYGIHVKIYQLSDAQGVTDPRPWLEKCARRGWTIFHIRRRNLIRHVLSNASRMQLPVSHFREGDGLDKPRYRINPADLLEFVEHRDATCKWEDRVLAGIDHEAFVYETDLADGNAWDSTAFRAFRRLSVEPLPVTTSLRKINTGSLRDLIENFDEVATFLASTPFAPMLSD